MNKVNFDSLKNLKAPEEWIENAINIPNTKQKKKPILAIFSNKSARLIAAAACLVLVSAISLTVFLTQDRITPPIDPNYEATEQAVETEAIKETEAASSAQTEDSSSGDNTQQPSSSSDYESIEPTETQTATTTQNGGVINSATQTATSAGAVPTVKPTAKPTTKPTAKPDSDSSNNPQTKPADSTGKPTVKPTVAETVKPTEAEPTIEPTEAPTVKPTQKPNTPPVMLALPTIPPPDTLPTEGLAGTPGVDEPSEPQAPPAVSPTEPPYIEPTEPPYVTPTEPSEPPYTTTEPTESTMNPNDLPHYVIDITNTTYCKLDEPICIGYIDPPVSSDDVFYCSVYDKNLNVIGYYGHYYYSDYLKASIKTYDSQRQQIRCEYSLKYREMVTSVGTYYYCFYNDKGKIVYWGKLVVYE